MQKSTDPQFLLLARISQSLKLSYMEDELIWEDSPFQWLKTRPSRQRGTIAEIFVSEWCVANGLNVGLSPDSDADRLIDGVRSEIKSSTLWSGGFYKFQQIRDQNYEIVICLGMSPFEAHCWVLPKKIILEGWGVYEGLKSQHGGKVGTDTAWLEVYPDSVQDWLREYGGSLSEGLAVLRSLVT
jgi:hypothetical protein